MSTDLNTSAGVGDLVHVQRVERLQRLLRRMAVIIGLVIAVAMPAGYVFLSLDHLQHKLTFKSELDADRLARYAYIHGEAWKFSTERIEETLIPKERAGAVSVQIVRDEEGVELTVVGREPTGPVYRQVQPIEVRGATVGSVEVVASLIPLTIRGLSVLAFSCVLGGFAYLLAYRLPLRALNEGLAQLHAMIDTVEHHAEESRFAFNDLERQHRLLEENAQELSRARERAEAADRAKSQFLANMSHELRTPLNAVIGFADLICSVPASVLTVARCREYATDIVNSGRHLLAIINDILDLAKVDAGEVTLDLQAVDSWTLVEASCRLLKPQLDAAQVQLMLRRPPGDLPAIMADSTRVKQVLVNLLSNAIKFTPEGGIVSVSAHIDGHDAVVLQIDDTGVGIETDQVERILQPFQQIDNSHTREHGGTGLGLPLSKRLVELQGGELSLDSSLGEGTRVRVRFPVAPRIQNAVGS